MDNVPSVLGRSAPSSLRDKRSNMEKIRLAHRWKASSFSAPPSRKENGAPRKSCARIRNAPLPEHLGCTLLQVLHSGRDDSDAHSINARYREKAMLPVARNLLDVGDHCPALAGRLGASAAPRTSDSGTHIQARMQSHAWVGQMCTYALNTKQNNMLGLRRAATKQRPPTQRPRHTTVNEEQWPCERS